MLLEHVVQAVVAVLPLLLNLPAAHCTQAVRAASTAFPPSVHDRQLVADGPLENVVPLHCVHTLCPPKDAAYPATQRVQALEAVALAKLPPEHAMHAVLPPVAYCPAVHCEVQGPAPPTNVEYVPPAHDAQPTRICPSEYVPPRHITQAVTYEVVVYVPARQ